MRVSHESLSKDLLKRYDILYYFWINEASYLHRRKPDWLDTIHSWPITMHTVIQLLVSSKCLQRVYLRNHPWMFWHLHDPGLNTTLMFHWKKLNILSFKFIQKKTNLSQYPGIAENYYLNYLMYSSYFKKPINFNLKCINSYSLEQNLNYEYNCFNLMFLLVFPPLLFTYTILLLTQ